MRSFYEGQTPRARRDGRQWGSADVPVDPRSQVQAAPGGFPNMQEGGLVAAKDALISAKSATLRQIAQENAMRYLAANGPVNYPNSGMVVDQQTTYRQRGRQYAPQVPEQMPVQTMQQAPMSWQDAQIMAQIDQVNSLAATTAVPNRAQMQNESIMAMINQSNALGADLRNRPMTAEDMNLMGMINQSNAISSQMRNTGMPTNSPADQDIMAQLAMVQNLSQNMGVSDYELALQEQHRYSQMKPRPVGNAMAQQGVFQRPFGY